MKLIANLKLLANWHTLQFTIAHIKSSMSSLGVAWQRISTMPLATVLTSLPADYHLTAGPKVATHWLWLLIRLAASLHNSMDCIENIAQPTIVPLLLCVHSLPRRGVYQPLPSNGRHFWFHYSDLQLPCYNIKSRHEKKENDGDMNNLLL
jgi:hypothetical protein